MTKRRVRIEISIVAIRLSRIGKNKRESHGDTGGGDVDSEIGEDDFPQADDGKRVVSGNRCDDKEIATGRN